MERERYSHRLNRIVGQLALASLLVFGNAIPARSDEYWVRYPQGGPGQVGNFDPEGRCHTIVDQYAPTSSSAHASREYLSGMRGNDIQVAEEPSPTSVIASSDDEIQADEPPVIGVGFIMPQETILSSQALGEPDPYQTSQTALALANCVEEETIHEGRDGSAYRLQSVGTITAGEGVLRGRDMCREVGEIQNAIDGENNRWKPYVDKLVAQGADKIVLVWPSINDEAYPGNVGCAMMTTDHTTGRALIFRAFDIEDWLTFLHEFGHTLGLPHETWDDDELRLLFDDMFAHQTYSDMSIPEICRFIDIMSTGQGRASYPEILSLFGTSGETHRNPDCAGVPMGDDTHNSRTRMKTLAALSSRNNPLPLPKPFLVEAPIRVEEQTAQLSIGAPRGTLIRFEGPDGPVEIHTDESGTAKVEVIVIEERAIIEVAGVNQSISVNQYDVYLPFVANLPN